MIVTMVEYHGVGIAAPQVHESLAIAVIESSGSRGIIPLTVLVNPDVTVLDEEMIEDWEGCLSIPDIRGMVPRFTDILVKALDRDGRNIELRLKNGAFQVLPTLQRGEWGVTHDDAGRTYRNTNESALHVDLVPTPYFARNPGLLRTRGSYERLADATGSSPEQEILERIPAEEVKNALEGLADLDQTPSPDQEDQSRQRGQRRRCRRDPLRQHHRPLRRGDPLPG